MEEKHVCDFGCQRDGCPEDEKIANDPTKWKIDHAEIIKRTKSLPIECSCGAVHGQDSEKFIAVYGNICIGIDGGMVGNNIHNGQVMRVSYMCLGCFHRYMCR